MTTALKACALAAIIAALALMVGPLLDGQPSDAEAEAAIAADLRDALAQAQAERPDLWTERDKAQAEAAIAVAAHHTAQQPRR